MLSKPFSPRHLLTTVNEVLQPRHSARGFIYGLKSYQFVRKPSVEASAIASKVLDNLAARFRPSGLFLAMAGPDGAITYGDSLNGLLFCDSRFPSSNTEIPPVPTFPKKLRGVNAGTPYRLYSGVPGVMVALVPWRRTPACAGHAASCRAQS